MSWDENFKLCKEVEHNEASWYLLGDIEAEYLD